MSHIIKRKKKYLIFKNNNKDKKIYSKDPEIYTINNFLSKKECNHIINISKNNFKRAMVIGDIISNDRTNSSYYIPHNYDDIINNICCKISKLVNISLENAEQLQIIYYDKNQEYKKHFDAVDNDNTEVNNTFLKRGGNRILTTLCYLNNVIEGGSTQMTKLNINIEPKIGKLLVFENTYKNNGIKHELSEHCGCPVIQGEKYAFNLWFRENKFV